MVIHLGPRFHSAFTCFTLITIGILPDDHFFVLTSKGVCCFIDVQRYLYDRSSKRLMTALIEKGILGKRDTEDGEIVW